MENKLSRWGGCGSYFPGNQLKLNFNTVHVIVIIIIIIIIIIIMRNKAIHVIGWNGLTFDFDLCWG